MPGKSWHRHIPLIGGKAKQCEKYPDGLVQAILRGLRKQIKRDHPIGSMSFGPTNEEVDVDLTLAPDDWETFSDEISGKALNAKLVHEARAEEIEYARRYKVWEEVPVQQAWDRTGKAPISSRWIDVNKGDEARPQYRSRLVIQEVRSSNIEAIFAATPPLESVRMLLSLQRTGHQKDARGRGRKVMFIDIRRAHWTARIFREVYVALPEEAGLPEGTCGRLLKAMYGCRDAAACWELEVTDMFTSCGFAPGLGSPVLFVNQTRDLKVSIHGDDITVLGFHDDLVWLRKKLEERYELKFGGLLGPEQTDVQNVALLNRLIHFGADCTTIEADPRHVKIVLNELGLNNAKTVSSPGVTCKDGDDTPLSLEDCKRFRSLTMRCNYLALDRPDINYSAKELARKMQNPTKSSWNGLKRLARYLAGCPRLIWKYEQQDEQFGLRIHTDSDDAGCTESRKSTSCGALYHGKHLLKFHSSTQHVISLSSGESEFYAGIKAGSTLLGALATMMDLGCQLSGTLVFDATAAKAMMNRRGHGKAKHISRCYLWLQQRVHDGELQLEKIGTKINTADLGTKHLDGSRIRELIEGMNLAFSDGQHSLALDA